MGQIKAIDTNSFFSYLSAFEVHQWVAANFALPSTNLLLPSRAALEATQGQNDSLFGQLPYKCYLEEVASVRD